MLVLIIFLQETAQKYGVEAMPTFMFFKKGGEKLGDMKGADGDKLESKCKEYLS